VTEKRFRADRPKSDPAGIKGMKDVTEAFKAIKAKSHATTGPAHILLNSIFGRPPPSISTETKDLGIARSVKALGAVLNTASASNAYVSINSRATSSKSRQALRPRHVRIDIDNGVIITSAITNEAVAEPNLKGR